MGCALVQARSKWSSGWDGRVGSPSHSAIQRRIQGEAVAVDLPGGRTLFALLRSDDDVDWAGNVMQAVAPRFEGEPFEEKFDNVLLVAGEVALPRMWPPIAPGLRQSGYPILVTFADLTDPTSVARVDPEDLAATFGEGVALRRITVQLTDDPVTTGIEERLGWIGRIKEMNLSLEDFPPSFPVGDFSGLFMKVNS